MTAQTITRAAPAGPARQQTAVIDTDIHPAALPKQITPRLNEPWRSRFQHFGARIANPPMIFPRVRNGGMRRDAWPEGGIPGSDLGLTRKQLLDEYDVDCGVLIPLQGHSWGAIAPDFAAVLCRALNEWIAEEWLGPEPRLRSSICVPHESPELAAREIERYAGDPRFVQVLFPSGLETSHGLGKYWPIYQAAAEAGLPVAIHVGGAERHVGDGWPSFYLEHHVWNGSAMAMSVVSLILSGLFDRLPSLQIVLVEGGITWAAPLMWAMDSGWSLLREDGPALRRLPSEYLRDNFWFTTQPIEEPDSPQDLAAALEHLGMNDRIMFASDYPHWDFDSPATALRDLPKNLRGEIMAANAGRLYGLGIPGPEAGGRGR